MAFSSVDATEFFVCCLFPPALNEEQRNENKISSMMKTMTVNFNVSVSQRRHGFGSNARASANTITFHLLIFCRSELFAHYDTIENWLILLSHRCFATSLHRKNQRDQNSNLLSAIAVVSFSLSVSRSHKFPTINVETGQKWQFSNRFCRSFLFHSVAHAQIHE